MKISKKLLSLLLCAVMVLSTVAVGGEGFAEVLGEVLDVFSVKASATSKNGTCGNNLIWNLSDDGILTISGEGNMWNWSAFETPWYSFGDVIYSVIIQDGVTSIGDYAFSWCSRLKSIDIPDNVVSIGGRAFKFCSKLESVTIGNGVKKIVEEAFYGCDKLSNISVSKDNKYFSSDKSGVLFNKEKNELIQYPAGSKITDYCIPTGVRRIDSGAFSDCINLVSIDIPDSVTAIGDEAFKGCTCLTDIKMGDNISNIGYEAFYDTAYYNDTSKWENGILYIGNYLIKAEQNISGDILIKNGVRIIEDEAFSNCTSLTSVSIPSSVISICDYAFAYCTSLDNIVIPDSVKYINDGAFNGCTKLKNINLSNALIDIGRETFGQTSIKVFNIPASVENIGEQAFSSDAVEEINVDENNKFFSSQDGVLFNKDKTELIQYPSANIRTNYTIPNSVINVAGYAFYFCTGLINITIPNSVTTIGEYGFYNCNSLQNVSVPNKIKRINSFTFCKCASLKSIDLPDSLTEIGGYAFSGCRNLMSILIPYGVTAINQETFAGCTKLTRIELPDTITEIREWAFSGCTDLSEIILGDNIENIGIRAFADTAFYDNSFNWKDNILYIGDYLIIANGDISEKISIKNGTRLIADEAFAFHYRLTEVDFPDSLEIIGRKAFGGCSNLSNITIPNSVKNIGDGAFSGCIKLSDINIGNGITSIGYEAFSRTGYYENESNWDKDILYIGNYLIASKKTLSGTVTIKENTILIGSGAFWGCFDLTNVILPDGIVTIDNGAFEMCTGLKSIKIPGGVKAIGKEAFFYCTNLASIIIPESVEKIETHAFGYAYITYSKYLPFAIYCYENTEGQKYAVDNGLNYVTIEKIPGTSEPDKCGTAHITVVDAKTKTPIENAHINITIDENDYIFSTDKNGELNQLLPIGELSFSVFADGYNVRNLKYTVVKGENNIPPIGLSSGNIYDAKLTSKEMTYDEIVAAGIDTEAGKNKHVFKYQLDISFDAEIDTDSLIYYLNADGEVIKGETKEGGSGKSIVWVPNYKTGEGLKTGGFFYDKEKDISLIPFSENFFLIIRGSVKWLKEMFDVEMLVINNSSTDTLENIETTLELPDGLSLAAMVDGEQTLKQVIGTISENGFKSAHWYVCGDKAGSYNLSAKLTGTVMPFSEEINKTFTTENALQIWAGNALHLDFEFPDAAFYGDDYPITVTLTNVSDKPLYQLSNVLQITEDMQYFYSNGEAKEKLTVKNIIGTGTLDAFNPGDKIIIETSANIFFESAIIEAKKKQLMNLVDELDKLYKAYKCITSAYKATETLIKSVSSACKAIDDFKPSLVEEKLGADKVKAVEKLYSSLEKLRKYTKSNNKIVDKVWDLFDCAVSMDVSMDLEKMSKNPISYFDDKKVEEIYKLYEKVKAVGDACEESVNKASGVEAYKFDLCDSIKTFISAIPVKFFASSIIMTASEDNTTDIPYSISTYPAGVHYFGVTNVSKYVMSIANLAVAKFVKGELPWYLKMFVDIDNIMNTDESLEYVKATEKEIKAFQAKDSTGEITWTVRVERNVPKSKALKVANTNTNNSSIDGFELGCSNENAVIKNGVMTFKGEGFIYVTPTSTDSGTLYIENSEGAKYIYNLSVVEPHSCTADEQEIIIHPTKEYDGIAVKRCSVCGEILEIIPLSCDLCESHEFNDWTTVYSGDCETRNIIQHACANCGYYETDVGNYGSHSFTKYVYNDNATTEHDGTETAKCDVCDETDTRTVLGTKKNPMENAVINIAADNKIDYRSIVTIKATATGVPEGYHLAMFIIGSKVADGTNMEVSYTYGELVSDLNYTVKVVDANGNVQKDAEGNNLTKDSKITVNTGFFKKLIAFFKGLFGSLPKIEVKP